MPTTYGSHTLLTTVNTGGDYNSYYAESCRVWDDVALAAWYHEPDSTVKFRAVRHNADNTVTLGPSVVTLADTGGTYSGTLSWAARLADGIAVILCSEVYSYTPGVNTDEPVIGFIVQVNQSTLACTVLGRAEVSGFTYLGSGLMQMGEGTNRVCTFSKSRTSFTGVDDFEPLGSITWTGSTFASQYRAMPVSDSISTNTVALVDLGADLLRVAVSGTNIEFRTFPMVNNLPDGSGTVRLTVARSSGWNLSHTYPCRVTDSITYFVAAGISSDTHTLWELNTDTWTLTNKGSIGSTINNSLHQDDWVAVEALHDLPEHFAVFYGSGSGITASLYNLAGHVETVHVMPYTGILNARRNVTGAYLSQGRFVISAVIDNDAFTETFAPVVIAGTFPFLTGQWRIFVTEDIET